MMNAYIYQADIYCADCGESIRKQVASDGPIDESFTDSEDYPQGPYSNGGGESDSPVHCGSGCDCLNAIELDDGHKVGAWLENDLTTDGVDYVREAIAEPGCVSHLWAEWYADELG